MIITAYSIRTSEAEGVDNDVNDDNDDDDDDDDDCWSCDDGGAAAAVDAALLFDLVLLNARVGADGAKALLITFDASKRRLVFGLLNKLRLDCGIVADEERVNDDDDEDDDRTDGVIDASVSVSSSSACRPPNGLARIGISDNMADGDEDDEAAATSVSMSSFLCTLGLPFLADPCDSISIVADDGDAILVLFGCC